MGETGQPLLRIARRLAAELKARSSGRPLRVRPPRMATETDTDGCYTVTGRLGPFQLQVWFDGFTGRPGRTLYAGIHSQNPSQMSRFLRQVRGKFKPVRIVTSTRTTTDGVEMAEPLAKAHLNRPVLERYHSECYYGLYNDRPGVARDSGDLFIQRAAKFLVSLASAMPGMRPVDGPYKPGTGDDRRTVQRAIRARQNQGGFREHLMTWHLGKCQVTDCNVNQLLDACHVHAYRSPRDDNIHNGLLLRTDVHTLFDLGLLWIEARSLRVRVAPEVRDPAYRRLDGRRLRIDRIPPSAAALDQHYSVVVRRGR